MHAPDDSNQGAREAWNANAKFWNDRMGDGNDFLDLLVWPAVERLLRPSPGERILDIACGNGVTSRRLAAAGASVVGVDFSERLIALAKQRGEGSKLDYRVVDATDHQALLCLGEEAFDRALCNMALMDIADVAPLMKAVGKLLRPGGALVFSVMHPCFNNPAAVKLVESGDSGEGLVTTYSVKISRYRTPYQQSGVAMHGQPVPHPYFHRSLAALLGPGFDAGLVLDGLEEPAFPQDYGEDKALSFSGRFSEIPPVLVARMRRSGR